MQTLGFLGGTGPQGRGLALRLALAGYPCLLGSRDAGRAARAAAEVAEGHDVDLDGAANSDVAKRSDVVILTLPHEALQATVAELAGDLAGKLVVSCVNPTVVDDRGPYWYQPTAGSAAEECQRLLPDSLVAAAFHTVSARKLLDASEPMAGDVPVCADDAEVRHRVVALVEAIDGLRGVHAGQLRLSFALEAFTSLIIAVNRHYRRSVGLGFVNLPVSR